VYNASPSLFPFLRDAKPERASTFDFGVRTQRAGLEGSLTLYHVRYRNRLIGISLCPPTVTCATGLGNVGSVTTAGAESLLATELAPGLRWLNSASYNASTFDNDYLADQSDPSSIVHTADKDVPDAPRWILSSTLEYTRGRASASLTGRHVAKRYFTYTNGPDDQDDGRGFVPAYTLVDAAPATGSTASDRSRGSPSS